MTTYGNWYISFTAVALLACDLAQADLSFELSPPKIAPGERSELKITLPISDLVDKYLLSEDAVPELAEDPLGASSLLVLDRNYERSNDEFTWRFSLTAYESGKLRIPPIEIKFGPQTFSTESRDLEVIGGREPGDHEIRPEFGPADPAIQIPLWLWVLAILAVAAGVFAYWKRKRDKEVADPGPQPSTFESPETWLRLRLKQLKGDLETGENPQSISEALSTSLKEYFQKRYQTFAPSWTLRETRTLVRKSERPTRFPENRFNDFEKILAHWEKSRYARGKTLPPPSQKELRSEIQCLEGIWLDGKPGELSP